MRGFGVIGDVVGLGLTVLSMLGWMYLWYLCVFGAEKVMARLFGDWAFPIAALGFPVVVALLLSVMLAVFGRRHLGWGLAIIGIALPMLGILYLRKEIK